MRSTAAEYLNTLRWY